MTPTSFVNVTRWTRTQSNRLLFDVGFGIYDQEYTELYQPDVLNGFSDKVWNSDADPRLAGLRASSTTARSKRQGALERARPTTSRCFAPTRVRCRT